MGATAGHQRVAVRLAELGLIALIFIGSLTLVATPLVTLWLLSRVSGDYATIYLMALVGCPVAVIGWGMVLVRLDRLLGRVRGTPAGQPRAGPVLEMSMTAAVLIALAALALWYVLGDVPSPGPRVVL
jgi:hypothetical protein